MSTDAVLRTFAVYFRPADLPGAEYAVREWHVTRRGPVPVRLLGITDTLDEARALIPHFGASCLARSEDDDPAVVETWL